MKDIKLVVFDIAGTTVKDNGEIAQAFHDAMLENGYDIPDAEIYPLMGYKKTEAIKKMLQEYEHDASKITEDYIDAIHELFISLMIEYYTTSDEISALPHALEVFAYLKKKDIKIGLDTGFPTNITNVIMDRLGWKKDGIIDYVVSSNEVPQGRPQPFMIRKMMEAAGIEKSLQVIKIGDTEVDVMEGKNAGCMYSIGITTGAFTREELEPYEPSCIFDGLDELIPLIEK